MLMRTDSHGRNSTKPGFYPTGKRHCFFVAPCRAQRRLFLLTVHRSGVLLWLAESLKRLWGAFPGVGAQGDFGALGLSETLDLLTASYVGPGIFTPRKRRTRAPVLTGGPRAAPGGVASKNG